MRLYFCTVWNQDYTIGEVKAPVKRIASIFLSGRTDREAAAQAYVNTVGRERVKKLKELNAPQILIRFETDYLGLAQTFGRSTIGPDGECCYSFDNMVETWLVTVKLESSSQQCAFLLEMRVSQRGRNSLYRALQFISLN